MGYEYYIRGDEHTKLPSLDELETELSTLSSYCGRVSNVDGDVIEFRSAGNATGMCDLFVATAEREIYICFNGGDREIRTSVLGTLILFTCSMSKAECLTFGAL